MSSPPARAAGEVSGKAAGWGVRPAPPWPPLTFRQGLEETSNEALKALRCCVVRMVRGRLGLRGSFPSSPLPLLWLPCPLVGFMSPSSSSLFTVEDTTQPISLVQLCTALNPCCLVGSICLPSPNKAGQGPPCLRQRAHVQKGLSSVTLLCPPLLTAPPGPSSLSRALLCGNSASTTL